MEDQKHSQRIHAFSSDVLTDLDAVGIAQLIKSKEASVQEITQAAIARAEQVNPHLNAIELDCFQRALEKNQYVEHGLFAGVPFFFKDNLDYQGLPSRHGSKAIGLKPADRNPQISQQILDQGFVVLGKSKLPEFGLNASTEYKDGSATYNPWHLGYSCGASSGGSAALVAAGVVPIAHANDGGGSIRIPAACCGLIGLKPSRGRTYDSEAAGSLPINIISEGVLTRSIRDTAHFYAGMESSYYNKKLPRIGMIHGPSKRRLRIGLVPQSITGQIDSETTATLMHSAALLEKLGHHVEELQLPFSLSFVEDFSEYWGMLSFLLSTFGKKIFGADFNPKELDHLTVGLSMLYKKNFYKTPLFLYRLKKMQQQYREIFKHYDVLLSPVLAHTTPKIGYLSPQLPFDQLFERIQNYVTFTPIQNVVGAPGMSIPMGETQNDGLPISMQISADVGDEKTLIELAYEIEEAQPWRRIQDVPRTA
ncbi:amidase [Acinetobacter sp. YH12054]|uniref:amidase n=1 Tax=Acinetobacter sp. YH12054 TaxID=2601056 RepID=UPI0015D2D203|nr:amidase [Acinetobacter sp. YH12054]